MWTQAKKKNKIKRDNLSLDIGLQATVRIGPLLKSVITFKKKPARKEKRKVFSWMPRNVNTLAWILAWRPLSVKARPHSANILREIAEERSDAVANRRQLISSRLINKLLGQYYYVQSKDWPLEKLLKGT